MEPPFGTAFPAGLDTVGPEVAALAERMLREPLMPWQRHVATVAGAVLEPAADGRPLQYRYRTVVLRVPRRAGKTFLMLATLLHRAGQYPRRRCWYTAQDRTHASRLFREDWAPMLDVPRLRPYVKTRLAAGSETITVRRPGSTIAVFSPGPRAIHSADADAVVVDEAWSFTDARGRELEQGIRPAQSLTTRTAQLWIVSAGGDHDSSWLHGYLDRYRHDPDPSTAVFDYSASTDDDIDDPDVLRRTHPAIGHTVRLETIWDDRETMTRAEWARAYLAVSTHAPAATSPAFDGAAFAALETPGISTTGRPAAVAFEVAHDRSGVAVLAGIPLDDGRAYLEVVKIIPVHAAAGYLTDLRRRHRAVLRADAHGPTAPLVDELRRRGTAVDVLTNAGAYAAVAALGDGITAGTVTHNGETVLTSAIGAAQRRRVGDAFTVQRGDMNAAVAMAAAVAFDAARVPSRPLVLVR